MVAYRGKYITVGIGTAEMTNAYEAAKYAAEKSIFLFEKPRTFSLVYANAKLNANEVARGINEVFGTKDWVGASADRQFSSKAPYSDKTTVTVLSIQTDYMHFGVGYSKSYRRNAEKAGDHATRQALINIRSDKYIDAYVQFSRTKNQEYSKIVKTPPYFTIAFTNGNEISNGRFIPGEEIEFVKGIRGAVGPHIQIFGGSASSDFVDFINNNKGSNYVFADGKAMKNTGIVIFVVTNLYYSSDAKHGYIPTEKYAVITKTDKTGYKIIEINNQPAVLEYCNITGAPLDKYLEDPFSYGLKYPFGLFSVEGETFIREMMPNPDRTSFRSTYKLNEKNIMNIMKYDEKNHMNTIHQIVSEFKGKGKVAVSLFCKCSTRRMLLGNETKKLHDSMNKNLKFPIFGFYSFTEFGGTPVASARVHSETVTNLTLFDKLLSD
jgi:hypothetical protein